MAIAVLAALLIHIVWVARSYVHADARVKSRVRAVAAIGSLITTTALFCLIQNTLQTTVLPRFYLGSDSATRQVVSVVTSPDNSVCYAETKALDGNAK